MHVVYIYCVIFVYLHVFKYILKNPKQQKTKQPQNQPAVFSQSLKCCQIHCQGWMPMKPENSGWQRCVVKFTLATSVLFLLVGLQIAFFAV